MTTVYLVVHDPDPGYESLHILGAFSTQESAKNRVTEYSAALRHTPDVGIIELRLDEPTDTWWK